ncbi:MAG TPA: hypothetical protein RMH99_06350 [Sandaracinaceae bacterium LLY-WYZ-13_1]|nr:hypothetical protein [Sandaracinaceae bacterium LLY-WYZ-13_1]
MIRSADTPGAPAAVSSYFALIDQSMFGVAGELGSYTAIVDEACRRAIDRPFTRDFPPFALPEGPAADSMDAAAFTDDRVLVAFEGP